MKTIFSFVKPLCLIVALAVVGSALVSCGKEEAVELQFYMLGDAPKDLPVIEAEINKLALAELNCTVKFNYIPWAGWQQKYNLLLTSGQPIDLLYTAEWTYYNDYSERGAFLDIEELLKKNAPELYSFVPASMWNDVRVHDKIYTVPCTWKEYVNDGVAYREDLRKKFNLPVPDSLENVEKYMEGIKKNVQGMQVTSQAKDFAALDSALMLKYPYVESPISGTSYGLRYDYRNPTKLYDYFESADFIEDAKMFKRWAEKGFWSKSALSVDTPNDALDTGLIAIKFDGMNPSKFAAMVNSAEKKNPTFAFGYVPYSNINKLVHPVHPTHNGFAVPRSAQHPEKALAFYQKLVMDKRYNHLTEYGIDGKNYHVTTDGHYESLGDPETNGFGYEAMNGWAWRNPAMHPFPKSYDIAFEYYKQFDSIATPNIRDGFVENKRPYQAQLAAFNQVYNQYCLPIYWGLNPDPEAAVKKFLDAAKTAGLTAIQDEVSKQWAAYTTAKGIK